MVFYGNISAMNWFDTFTLVIVGASAIYAFFKGFIREVIGIAGLIGGTFLAFMFYSDVAIMLKNQIKSEGFRNLAAFALIFALILILMALISFAVKKLFYSAGLSFYDRLLGLLFGALRGILIVYVCILALNFFNVATKDLKKSKSYHIVIKTYKAFSGLLPKKEK
jgi:membrane protein required for colicin V production